MTDGNGVDGPAIPHGDFDERLLPEDVQRRRSRWSAAIETFSPIWYALVMNTGILSVLMHQLPYQFSALGILSTIMFVFALMQFVVITLLQITRLILFPKSVYRQTSSDGEQACLWGCGAIALLTLTAQVALTASTAKWGYHDFSVVAYVLWWIATAIMLTCAMVVYISLVKTKHMADLTLTAAIFIPAVGTTTDALIGALVCTYSSDLSARLAVPIIITGYMLLGLGLCVSICVYALFFYSFWAKGMWLPGAKYPGLFLFVGPMGQSASAIQNLGTAVTKNFPAYNRGTFLTQEAASPISAISTMLGLMFIGFDLFWLLFALYFLIEGAVQKKLSFTMTWWSTIFPVATLAVAWLTLGIDLDSPTFRVLSTGLFLILLIDYFICWGFTVRGIWNGSILDGRELLAQMAKKSE